MRCALQGSRTSRHGPPRPWSPGHADLVTRNELANLATKADLAELKATTQADLAALKVHMRDFEVWLGSDGHSPAEMNLKSRLR